MPTLAATGTAPLSEAMINDFRGEWADTLRAEIKAFEISSKATLAAMKEGLRAIQGNGGVQTSRAGNGHTATTQARKRSRPSRARTATAGKSPNAAAPGVSNDQVLDAIRRGNTQSPQIADAIGARSDTVLRRLNAMRASGLVRSEGEKRQTRWIIVDANATRGGLSGTALGGAGAQAQAA